MKDAAFSSARLLQLYDRVSDADDAIPRLRRFVLNLAVRGKLVEQDTSEETASVMLMQAQKSLRRQAETAKRVRWKHTDPVSVDELDKEMPVGWVAGRVNDTGLYINGLAFKPADWKQSGIPIIRIQNLTNPTKEFNYAEGDFPDEVMVRNGDLLVSWSATLEAFKWNRGEGVLNQHIFRVIPVEDLADRGFLLLLLRHAIREMAESEHAHGLTMTHINRGPFLNHIVLIPPLAEQRRIVTKVDELIALCDQLEEARVEREVARDRLTAASLARLTAPETTEQDFQSHARFALQTLPALTTRSDQIKTLRHTILNLAVRGKLVEQGQSRSLEEDQAALTQIEAKRLAVSQNNSDRKRVLSEFISLRDAWNAAPSDARRITTFCSCHFITKGTTPSKNKLLEKGDIPFLKVYNIVRNELDFAYRPAFISRETHESSLGRSRVRPNDVIMNIVGPPLGKVAIVTDEYSEWNINQALSFFRPLTAFSSAYIALMLKAPETLQEILGETRGTVGQDNLSLEQVRSISFPFIPLAEQHRIVAKVDALMALCDRLEASLTTADTTRARLLDALLHEALAPDAEAMEAAE